MDGDHFKSLLNERLKALFKREAALEKHLRGEDGRLDEDFSDRVAFTEMDEVIEQLDDDARLEIRAIRAALQRITDGKYGACVTCGKPIPRPRLEILPHAAQCVACAA